MKKWIKAAAALSTALVLCTPHVNTHAENEDTAVAMYRMYNPNSGEHFFTANAVERLSLLKAGWDYEGVGWYAPSASSSPVYRLYNPNAGLHHYTVSTAERDMLITAGWSYEGIGWYSYTGNNPVKIYREYCYTSGQHNYTSSYSEHLIVSGWNDWTAEEGGWNGMTYTETVTDVPALENTIFIGDSYAEGFDGYYTHYEEGWADLTAKMLGINSAFIHREGGSGFTVKGNGGTGTTFYEALNSYSYLSDAVNCVVVEGGYNDWKASETEFKNALRTFIVNAKVLYPNAKIVVGINGWDRNRTDIQAKLISITAWAEEICREQDAYYVDGIEHAARYAGASFYPDGVHLCPSSNRTVAEKTKSYLLELYR